MCSVQVGKSGLLTADKFTQICTNWPDKVFLVTLTPTRAEIGVTRHVRIEPHCKCPKVQLTICLTNFACIQTNPNLCSEVNKNRLKWAISVHFYLLFLMMTKLSPDILDRLDIFVLELEELFVPKVLLFATNKSYFLCSLFSGSGPGSSPFPSLSLVSPPPRRPT